MANLLHIFNLCYHSICTKETQNTSYNPQLELHPCTAISTILTSFPTHIILILLPFLFLSGFLVFQPPHFWSFSFLPFSSTPLFASSTYPTPLHASFPPSHSTPPF